MIPRPKVPWTSARDELFEFVRRNAYKEGNFTLASGRQSNFYFNGKAVLFDQNGSRLFAHWLLEELQRLKPRPVAVGGLEIGAIPIACTAMALADFSLQAFVVRKKAKEHGTALQIEGPLRDGELVAIVDDVITTGESSLKAIKAVEAAGCTVAGVYCLVDREEGHSAEFQAYADRLHPAFTLRDFRTARE